jgi:hypothetical protein
MTTDRSKVIGEVYPGAKNDIDRMVMRVCCTDR